MASSEKELLIKTNDIKERLKEINCLYSLAQIIENCDKVPDLLHNSVNVIPLGWQYPEITICRICYLDNCVTSKNFRETKWKQQAYLLVDGKKQGLVEVFYLEEKQVYDEGPFFK